MRKRFEGNCRGMHGFLWEKDLGLILVDLAILGRISQLRERPGPFTAITEPVKKKEERIGIYS